MDTDKVAAFVPRTPWRFFALTFLLAVPFWVLGWQWGALLLPGLPVAALGAICPGLAAVILARREGNAGGFLLRSVSVFGGTGWPFFAILLALGVGTATFAVLHIVQGTSFAIARPAKLAVLIVMFLIGAWCEELGWSGYATDPLTAKHGTFVAALIIGIVWAVWHYIPLLQAGHDAMWIAWWTLGTLATRFILVGLYTGGGGSVPAAVLFHATSNLCVFGMNGTYDVRVTAIVLSVLAACLIAFGRGNGAITSKAGGPFPG